MNASAAAHRAAPTESVFVRIPAAAVRHGAINLAQGVFDHGPPPSVLAALGKVDPGPQHQYAPSAGHPALRAALAGHVRRHDGFSADPDTEITVTAGATEALYCTLTALIGAGDEAIVVEPAYEQYAPVVRSAGGVVRPIRQVTPDARLDVASLDAVITPATKVIVVNSPWNPLGRSLEPAEWQAIADASARHGIVVVSDEAYEHLMLDGRAHHGVLRHVADPELRVKISSASKTMAVTGWRVGWAVAGPELTRRIRAAHQFVTFSSATPLQLAVAAVIEDPGFGDLVLDTAARLRQRVGEFVEALTELGLSATAPEAGFFVLADVEEDAIGWCERMLVDQGVAGLPLSVFYSEPVPEVASTVRFALCKKDSTLTEAADRLRARLAGAATR